MIRLKVTTTTVSSAEKIAKIYRDKIWKLHGVLQKVLNDRGPQFALKFMEELNKTLETKKMLSTVYHSQTDSQTE